MLVCLLVSLGVVASSNYLFKIVARLRMGILTGDTGDIILGAIYYTIFEGLFNGFLFWGIEKVFESSVPKKLSVIKDIYWGILEVLILIGINQIVFRLGYRDYEFWNLWMGSGLLFILIGNYDGEKGMLYRLVISFNSFFIVYWMSIMPFFSGFALGNTDIAISIKLAATYINGEVILNFMGMFFILFSLAVSILLSVIFVMHQNNIKIIKENYENEAQLQIMKQKALENRMYREINGLAHDLKTPLVTIRGLNSMFLVNKNPLKIEEYANRIDNAIEKMTEMISSFLYESSRQKVSNLDLIKYIQAQVPTEREDVKISLYIEGEPQYIYINKIRVVRALINIIENALVVPTEFDNKQIDIRTGIDKDRVFFEIEDNGIGIPDNHLKIIWERGYSTNKTTGLGLAFVKEVMEANEGDIQVESSCGKGTLFRVFFPKINKEGGETID